MYKLPELPYAFDALEPIISKEILELHYSKHHAGYVSNLNAAIAKYKEAEEKEDLASMIALQGAIQFNGGGHLNHSLFWTILTPAKKALGKPKGKLLSLIERDFSSFEKFVELFSAQSSSLQGSGWCFLAYNKAFDRLEIVSTANHGILKPLGLNPLLVIDVWEHAYYLQYKNMRASFVKEFWKIVNWEAVENYYLLT